MLTVGDDYLSDGDLKRCCRGLVYKTATSLPHFSHREESRSPWEADRTHLSQCVGQVSSCLKLCIVIPASSVLCDNFVDGLIAPITGLGKHDQPPRTNEITYSVFRTCSDAAPLPFEPCTSINAVRCLSGRQFVLEAGPNAGIRSTAPTILLNSASTMIEEGFAGFAVTSSISCISSKAGIRRAICCLIWV